jgi:hypothetical protein
MDTLTGYRFVLTTDVNVPDLRAALWHIYSELFVGFALKNPYYVPGTPVESIAFKTEVDRFIRSLPSFSVVGAGATTAAAVGAPAR